jgi:hypothetical protein
MRAVLLKVSAYIRTIITKDREVPPIADKRQLPKGYWQDADWVYGLLALGATAERMADQSRSSS